MNKFDTLKQNTTMKKTLTYKALLLVAIFFSISTYSQEQKSYKVACVGFYNLENLFDYEDDTTIWDEEYMPNGAKAWDSTKYKTKLNHMAKVISKIGTKYTPDGPAVLGVCEVENKRVLDDLVKEPQISKRDYKIVHFDSPDRRGIDVGLLYQEKYFKFKNAEKYAVHFEGSPDKKTRDQLVVSGTMDGEEVNIIVAHWPSRSGGSAASQPRRIDAAKVGRRIVDSLLLDNPAAKIIYMGDLNDDPTNISVTEYLRGIGKKKKLTEGDLWNTMWAHAKAGTGSLAYRDVWNLFDQIIVSQELLSEDESKYVFHKSVVFWENFMLNPDGNYKGYPLRTHAGGAYQNGYSDHFPTYIILKKLAN